MNAVKEIVSAFEKGGKGELDIFCMSEVGWYEEKEQWQVSEVVRKASNGKGKSSMSVQFVADHTLLDIDHEKFPFLGKLDKDGLPTYSNVPNSFTTMRKKLENDFPQ